VVRRSTCLLWLAVAVLSAPAEPADPDEHPTAETSAPARSDGAAAAAGHDPASPPVDCPLRQRGIDPTSLRPFADVERYIAFLDRPDRAAWQKPDQVVAALGLLGHETVVDLGAGSGYFTFRLARALPQGRVVAMDTEPEMVRHIHHRAQAEGFGNVEARLVQADDPAVPGEADLVFVCDVLHHVPDRSAWLRRVVAGMRAGARLVLIEFKEGPLPEGPPESAKIDRSQLLELATGAGLVVESEQTALLSYQTFLALRKAP
jgi:SAM-dependent methyltransferase